MSNYQSEETPFLFQYDDDLDSQSHLFQLQQEIDRLKEENYSIKNQFNEATSMGDQLEKVHQQNIQLTKQLRIVNSERDDLQRRLDISLQRNDELKRLLDQERPTKKIIIDKRSEDQTILEKEKFKWQNEKNNFQLKISELQQLLQKEQSKTNEIQSSISNLIGSTSRYFNRNFSTVNDIYLYLSQCPPQQPPPPKRDDGEKDLIIESLNQKIKKQRIELKELKKLYTIANSKASQFESDTLRSREEAETLISGLESKITEVQHNYQLHEIQFKHEIETKDNQIKSLQEVINKMVKKQNETFSETAVINRDESNNEIAALKKSLNQYKEKLHEYNKTISQLKYNNSQLTSQLAEVNTSNEQFKKKYSSSENQIGSILSENDKLKNSISAIQIECDKLNEQYQTSISQIQNLESVIKQNETGLIESNSTNEKLKNSLNILNSIMEKQKFELNGLYDERDKIIAILQKENLLLKNYEIQIQRISEENRFIKKSYQAEQMKVASQLSSKPEIEVPYTSWFCKEFPQELNSVITDTAKNDNLPVTAKLKYVLTLIAQFYNKIITDLGEKCENSEKELSDKSKIYQNIFDSVLTVAHKAIESFSNNCQVSPADIPKIMDQVRNSLETKEEDINNLNEKLLSVYSKLGSTEIEEALSTINNLYETIDRMKQQIERQRIKIIKKKKEYQNFKTKCISGQKEIENLVNEQQSQYEFILNERENLIEKVKNLEKLNETLQKDLSEMKSLHKDAMDEHEKKCDKEITFLKTQIDEIQNQYSQELTQKEKQIFEMEQKIQQNEKEISQWKKTTELLKKNKIDKENQILEITSKIQDAERNRQKKAETEKAALKTQYEQVFTNLNQKNEELRKLILKSSKALEDLQMKNKDLMNSCTQLSIEKQQNLAKIDSLKEEFERERRLMETKLKAAALSTELQTQNALEQLKSQNDFEKRNIFGFIAATFRQFFNANEILNENSFKPLIQKVQTELLRLYKQEAALRKTLGITKNESIEDHISKLLLDYYHTS